MSGGPGAPRTSVPALASGSPHRGVANAGHAPRPLPRGTWWAAVVARTREALACGALAPIETAQETIEDGGVRFVVQRVSTLTRKTAQPAAARSAGLSPDPRFPLERELYVGDPSDTHLAVLNKFPVIPHHLLLVTRRYVPQEALLDRDDFAVLAAGLAEFDALAFYNGGAEAGASQPHKHLQLVPLPLGERGVPLRSLLDRAPSSERAKTVPGLPFRHAYCRCEALLPDADARLAAAYRELLAAVGIASVMRDGWPHQSAPYNLLVARGWMLLVARRCERFDGISVNALGYAGSIFVRNDAELARVRAAGPMTVLRSVAMPAR